MTKESTPTISGMTTYKRLLKYLLPSIKFFIVSIIGFAIMTLSQPLLAEMIKIIIETLETGNKSDTQYLPLYIIALVSFRSLGSFLGNYFLIRVSVNVVHKLRSELFNHYTQLSTEYFDAQNSGNLISLITYNVAEVSRAVTDSVRIFIREGLTAVGLLAYLSWINWQLTLVFLAIAPIIAILITVVNKRLRALSKHIQNSMGDMTHITSELVLGNRVVKCFGGSPHEIQRFKENSLFNKQQSLKVGLFTSIQNPIMQLLVAFALATLLFLALQLMESASTGTFVSYLLAAFMMPKSIQQLTKANSDIQKGIAAASDIFEVLDVEVEKDLGTRTKIIGKGELEFKNLSFYYPKAEKSALKNINLKIKSGQTIPLLVHRVVARPLLPTLFLAFMIIAKERFY